MYVIHKLTSMGAMLCDVFVVRTCEPFTADEEDRTKMTAWVL